MQKHQISTKKDRDFKQSPEIDTFGESHDSGERDEQLTPVQFKLPDFLRPFAVPQNNSEEVVQKEKAVNLTGIPDSTKEKFEESSGFSFDDVRVNYNSDKPAELSALAYTQGNQVHIAPGQERHLEHELGHVVQQKQGRVQPTMNIGGVAVNDDAGLEREADNGVLQFMRETGSEGDVIQRVPGLQIGTRVFVNDGISKPFRGKIVHFNEEKENNYIVEPDENVGVALTIEEKFVYPFKQSYDDVKKDIEFYEENKNKKNATGEITFDYSKNKIIDETEIFNLGGKSGVLLTRKVDGTYKVHSTEQNKNFELFTKNDTVRSVITIGISTCSFIVISDDDISFAIIAHLDSKDKIDNLIAQIDSLGLQPTRLFASIISEGAEEEERITSYQEKFPDMKIQKYYRGDAVKTSNHHMIGFDLQSETVFGKQGMPVPELEHCLHAHLNEFVKLKELIKNKMNGKNSQLDILLESFLPRIEVGFRKIAMMRFLEKLGKDNSWIHFTKNSDDFVLIGAQICLSDKIRFNELLNLLFDAIGDSIGTRKEITIERKLNKQ
jgi:hypothetical protein